MTIFTFRWHASNGMAYQILVCRILRNFNLCKVCSPFVGGARRSEEGVVLAFLEKIIIARNVGLKT